MIKGYVIHLHLSPSSIPIRIRYLRKSNIHHYVIHQFYLESWIFGKATFIIMLFINSIQNLEFSEKQHSSLCYSSIPFRILDLRKSNSYHCAIHQFYLESWIFGKATFIIVLFINSVFFKFSNLFSSNIQICFL